MDWIMNEYIVTHEKKKTETERMKESQDSPFKVVYFEEYILPFDGY